MSGLDDMPLEGWYAAISAALHAHDMKAAAGLIALMATSPLGDARPLPLAPAQPPVGHLTP